MRYELAGEASEVGREIVTPNELGRRCRVQLRDTATVQLLVKDESATGKETGSILLEDLPSSVSVRDLVRFRVREEVARHNNRPAPVFRGLVQPADSEVELNGYRLREQRKLEWEKQADVAVKAFAKNGYFVIVDGRQVESLDETVKIKADTEVSFVRLVPLVGG